jgi:hypothetical protein
MMPPLHRLCYHLVLALLLVVGVGGLIACRDAAPAPVPSLPEVPAQRTADDLATREVAERVSAATAKAEGDTAAAARHAAIADELAKLRADAQARATAERHELATLTAQHDQEAQDRAAKQQREDDRRRAILWAGGGIALSVATAALLLWWGLPLKYAAGIPGAVNICCVTGAAWFAAGDLLLGEEHGHDDGQRHPGRPPEDLGQGLTA